MNIYTARAVKLLAIGSIVGLLAGPAVGGAPPEDRILALDQYSSEKARQLATTHARALSELNAAVYHCLPWLEIQRQSIGFFRPKGSQGDERYLSMRVYVEQDASPEFSRLTTEGRAAAMFSRYVGPLLRRMTADRNLMNEPAMDGFTIIIEWLKQGGATNGERPVHETIAVFITKAAAADYLAGRASASQLANGARVLGWDGEAGLGELKLAAWDDNFVATYKVANYEADKSVSCSR